MSLADIPVEIPGLEETSLTDMKQRDKLIARGKAAMRASVGELVKLVSAHP